MSHSLPTALRTTVVGTLRTSDAGDRVRLAGWVQRRRDLGGLVFVDLRDRSGLVQLSFGPDWTPPEALERARRLGAEDVIGVEGAIVERPAGNANAELPTGAIEVHADTLAVLSEAETPPIPVMHSPGDELPAEDLRLRYRHLDLRRQQLQRALELRHHALGRVRRYLSEQGFWEIETPMLTRRTPEGARDYLVPSRLHTGEFYALPQSPQLYKQVLMVAGYDRYFQIARCLRDEDLRADRQPEFTQIDLELSFVSEEDVFRAGEGLISELWSELLGVELATPFPRLTYRDSLDRYGTDKPDLRFGMEFQDVTELLQESDFRLFRETRGTGARIRGIRAAEAGAALSRRELDQLADIAGTAGADGALWVRRTEGGLSGPFARALEGDLGLRFFERTGLAPGDLFVLVIGEYRTLPLVAESHLGATDAFRLGGAECALDALRRHLGDRLGLRDPQSHRWAWITEFPLFDWDVEADRLAAAQHPFTGAHSDGLERLLEATRDGSLDRSEMWALFAQGIRGRAYDAVYNGQELASGSIRIHDLEVQRRVFRALGIGQQEADAKFGFLLEAFRHGVPPHGGVAFGFDRLVMLMAGVKSLRDVIAFPKTTAARGLFEGAPAPVESDELRELHIAIADGRGS